jgi:hypothetical protein
LDGAREHRRAAVREDAGAKAALAQASERRGGVREGVERAIGVEQRFAQSPVDRRAAGEGVVERPLGQGPERLVASGKRQHPAVFELLCPPDLRQPRRIRPDRRRVPRHRRMHVEQRAVSVEHDGAASCEEVG